MDLLKQLETKLQTLVQQRTQLKGELEALKAEGFGDSEALRAEVTQLREERDALQRERDEVCERLKGLLAALEAAG